MALVRCPICGKRFESTESTNSAESANTANMPFCSERCRRIDLGRWLGEAYSVPVERDDENELDDDAGLRPQ